MLLSYGSTLLGGHIPFSSKAWKIDARNHEILEFEGREALKMKGGVAWLEDSNFTNGTIEFDFFMAGDRGFFGGIWRMTDRDNYEEFYVRPHNSGLADANQYTPVFNGMPGWQLYHGPQYGTAVTYNFNQWVHIKIVVSGTRAEIYINSQKPVLSVSELKMDVRVGRVGLSAGAFSHGHFSNFSYQSSDQPEMVGEAAPPKPAPKNLIQNWSISDAFAESNLEKKVVLTPEEIAERQWSPLTAEETGITNLARLRKKTPEKDTVFAVVTLNALESGVKELRFGYSDRARVYLNGQLIYSGTNGYRSRDYRYLGTMGLFDGLYLPLKKGPNQLILAISESFGGWGVLATVEDRDQLIR